MNKIGFSLPLKPKACPRPRVAARGKFAHAYYPATYTAWTKEFLEKLKEIFPDEPEPMFQGAVIVEIINKVKLPKSTKREFPPYDVDNYAKSVLDAITSHKSIWNDDDQVRVLTVSKEYAEENVVEVKIMKERRK